MARNDGTRFTKAATPLAGKALNVSGRMIGQNLRGQKLTEGSGTNPSKFGKTSIEGGPGGPGKPGKKGGYAQDTAPYKHDFSFGVGGPGLTKF